MTTSYAPERAGFEAGFRLGTVDAGCEALSPSRLEHHRMTAHTARALAEARCVASQLDTELQRMTEGLSARRPARESVVSDLRGDPVGLPLLFFSFLLSGGCMISLFVGDVILAQTITARAMDLEGRQAFWLALALGLALPVVAKSALQQLAARVRRSWIHGFVGLLGVLAIIAGALLRGALIVDDQNTATLDPFSLITPFVVRYQGLFQWTNVLTALAFALGGAVLLGHTMAVGGRAWRRVSLFGRLFAIAIADTLHRRRVERSRRLLRDASLRVAALEAEHAILKERGVLLEQQHASLFHKERLRGHFARAQGGASYGLLAAEEMTFRSPGMQHTGGM